jgi:hypothetical protein
MLIFENWKKILILFVSIFAITFSMPNFISKDNLPSFLEIRRNKIGS